jgi:ubiquinone/menaquinone biosynthesis C-methylase UbiE
MFRSKDREKCQQLYEKYYTGHKFHDAIYRELIQKYLPRGGRLLDAGCGRYLKFSKEFAQTADVVGIDLESALETANQCSPFGVRGDLSQLPFPTGHFDLVISRYVVEHLEDPGQVFREFRRVLKPGGKVILATPNKYDYVSVIAAISPYRWHRALVSRIFRVSEDDVYPTLYRANTLGKIGKELRSAGLAKRELRAITHYPAYLMISPVLFRLGVLYERITSLEMFRSLRSVILCVFEKEAGQKPAIDHEESVEQSRFTSVRT